MPSVFAENPSEPDWSWKLRLFLSADIVGSTEFKSRNDRQLSDWAPTFREFFKEFPQFLINQYTAVVDEFTFPDNPPTPPQPATLWKCAGDEILFEAVLTTYFDVLFHLDAFRRTIVDFPVRWRSKGLPLNLKGTAWVAGFPVTNAEVLIDDGRGSQVKDYIGPSIDLGFRLARHSTPRKLVMSAGLVYTLIEAVHDSNLDTSYFPVYFDGRLELKGVTGNRPYPIAWLDVHSTKMGARSFDQIEDMLTRRRSCIHEDLRRYYRAYFESTPNSYLPFIASGGSAVWGRIPDDFEDLRKKMRDEDTGRGFLSGGDQNMEPGADDVADADVPAPSLPEEKE